MLSIEDEAPALQATRSVPAEPVPRVGEVPVPLIALDVLEAALIVELVMQGASASVLTVNGSTLLHLFCRRCAHATSEQLARLVVAHPAQRVAIDGRGRTPMHCLVSSATDLTPEVRAPLLGDGSAVAVAVADALTPPHAACADRVAVRPDVFALLIAAHLAAFEKLDAAGATPLDYALAFDTALVAATFELPGAGRRHINKAAWRYSSLARLASPQRKLAAP